MLTYQLAHESDVRIDVCNLRGAVLARLANHVHPAGMYMVEWPLSVSGTYVVRMTSGSETIAVSIRAVR